MGGIDGRNWHVAKVRVQISLQCAWPLAGVRGVPPLSFLVGDELLGSLTESSRRDRRLLDSGRCCQCGCIFCS
jgi:hypothetical protein